jgi:peptide chain release factor 3
MDLPAKEPFALMDNIEQVLGITCVPFLWPMGSGTLFKGLYNLRENTLHRFEKTTAGAFRVPEKISGIDDPELLEIMGERDYQIFHDEVIMAREMLPDFDMDLFHATEITPVLFGSAGTNFGIELLLNEFLKLAPSPQSVTTSDGLEIKPEDKDFRAFVFKLQANMNKAHRDRVAFVRILSGTFERGMQVFVPRLEKTVKLSSPVSFFGQERSTIDNAYPGDVIGLINPRLYQIGDILCEGDPVHYSPLPTFAPEAFASLVLSDTSKSKAFRKGIIELAEEGVVQVFNPDQQSPIIGGIGQLQFDVFKFRLEDEYGAPCRIEMLGFECSRWIKNESDQEKFSRFDRMVRDHAGNLVVLFESQYRMQSFIADYPEVELLPHPPK